MNMVWPRRLRLLRAAVLAAFVFICVGDGAQTSAGEGPRTIVALQPSRQTSTVAVEAGGTMVQATLINLNPAINTGSCDTTEDRESDRPRADSDTA